jgi:dTDP-4-amino-4,6-dideoxygalactose transaminase
MSIPMTSPGRRAPERLEDLAVFSGRPAFPEARHVGQPNIGNVDRFLGLAREALERRWLTNNGALVQDLEKRIAAMHGVRHCVALANGTLALDILLRAAGVGGEVIVPAYTFVATAHAVLWAGMTPVFADVDPESHNLTAAEVDKVLTPRTSAVVGVHLWGRGDGAEGLEALAHDRRLKLFFDAAHGFGCSHRGRMLGAWGEGSIFSFHATKCFHTFEGGALLTQDDRLAERARLLRNFGFAGFDNVVSLGTNAKMHEISAAMGLTLLEDFDRIVAHNRANYEIYRRALAGLPGVRLQPYSPDERCNYQYVVMEVDARAAGLTRDELMAVLHRDNIMARRYFFPGCHRMEPYRSLPRYGNLRLPAVEALCERVLCLPTGTAISGEEAGLIGRVIALSLEQPQRIRSALSG